MTWRPAPGGDLGSPRRLGKSLDRVARALGVPRGNALALVFEQWADIVGTELASHSRPVSLAEGTLLVATDHPARASELRFRGQGLVRQIELVAGEGIVSRVEVRVRR
jgi:predicted nucleic acid-binding Zn ribbon protein